MTKRFKLRLSKLGNGMITDTQKREDLYFDKEFLDATLPEVNEWLNTLNDENEQLKQQIKDLRIDVLDSIHEADEIKCTCNPCVVEECVKRVVE